MKLTSVFYVGKKTDSGNNHHIFDFRVESDDEILKNNYLSNVEIAKHSSHRNQNELITLC